MLIAEDTLYISSPIEFNNVIFSEDTQKPLSLMESLFFVFFILSTSNSG
jgi:hypothetical protein